MAQPGPEVAWVGLGAMGSGMARTLLHHGVRFKGDSADIPENHFTKDPGGRALARQAYGAGHYDATKDKPMSPGSAAVHGKNGNEIWRDYLRLVMKFPVRCKYPACSGKFFCRAGHL